MRRIIENLRERPEEHRRHILNISTVVVTVIMVSLWVVSLGSTLSEADLQKNISKNVQPISALRANIVDGYKSISNSGNNSSTTELDAFMLE